MPVDVLDICPQDLKQNDQGFLAVKACYPLFVDLNAKSNWAKIGSSQDDQLF